MNFLFLGIFPGFFLFYFRFLNRFFNKNKKKFFFRKGPAWMRRGTQGHVATPRGPAQRLRGAISNFGYYLYILYSFEYNTYNPLFIGRQGKHHYTSGLINPTKRFDLIRVGLIHAVPYTAGDVARRGSLDRDDASISRVDRMENGPPNNQRARAN